MMEIFQVGDLIYISPKQTFFFFESSYGIVVECNFPSLFDNKFWSYKIFTCTGHTRLIVESDPFWNVILISRGFDAD